MDINRYELPTLIGTCTILLLYSFSIPPVIYKFFKSKKNQEMLVREPKALILMVILFWASIVFESIFFLSLDLGSVDDDWSGETFHGQKWGVLGELSIFCFLAGATSFFYRSWMLFVKNGIVREVNSHFFVSSGNILSPDPDKTLLRTYSSALFARNRGAGNRQSVGCVLTLFLGSIMAVIVVVGETNPMNDGYEIRKLILYGVGIAGLIFESYVICNIKDRYGTVVEYKVLTAAGFLWMIITIIMEEGITHFYGLLVEYLCWSVSLLILIIWLYFYIGKFSVLKIKSKVLEDFELYHVLRKKTSFERFRTHAQLSLCIENLEFFVDIYTIRKTLAVDPYLALSEDETEVIRKCARVKMPWIDDVIAENPGSVPTMKNIYDLYIKPCSDMEVNISGKLQTRLVGLFSSKEHTTSPRFFSTELSRIIPKKQELKRGGMAIMFNSGQSNDLVTSETSPTAGKKNVIGNTSSTPKRNPEDSMLNIKSPEPKLSDKESFVEGTSTEPRVPSEKSVVDATSTDSKISATDKKHPRFVHESNESVRDQMEEQRLIDLYPVWKQLITLLKNDTFVRFKFSVAQEGGIMVVV